MTLVCGALTIALGACSGDKAGESSSQITIGIPQDIEDSLDPHKAVAAGTKEVLFNLYEGLVKPDSSGELQPAIASDYSISEDATTYTFTLREGVKFHDGSMVTAEDVKYSIDRCADTTNGEPLVEAYSNIKSVNIVDEKTVEVVLNTADSDFLANMTTAIIPASNENPDTNPIGTGPYRYVSRSPQENFVVEKFDEYWGTPANIENVTFRVCANADSIVMNLQGGSIDMFARLTTTQASQLGDQFDVLEGTMNLVQALYLNNAVEPFNDERVRQALCYAVDPQGIMDLISDGKGTEIGSSMFPAFEKYYMPELNDVYNQDYDKAKELLAEAGYPDGFSFDIELDPVAAQAARDNGAENRVDFQVVAGDLRHIETLLPPGGFDGCVANPPYFPVGSGASGARPQARSEVTLTLKELCRAAQWLLTYGGRFALVHRPERLADLMEALRAHQLEPKRLRLLRHRAEKPPSLLLLEAKKGAKPGLVWEPDLILRDEAGRESAACRALYHRDGKDCD